MFLKTTELKKFMKSALKGAGLTVGAVNGSYLVYCTKWGASIDQNFAPNKFKAAIMELIGDLPEEGECYTYTISSKGEIAMETVPDYPDSFEQWKMAKDCAVLTPLSLYSWPHEYSVFQRKRDRAFITADARLIRNMISPKELDSQVESMPGQPSVQGGLTLYYKNDTTIYWVAAEPCGENAREVLFPRLAGMDFFESGWIPKEDPVSEERDDTAGETLP